MTAKETSAEEWVETGLKTADALVQDIYARWPVWLEIVKAHGPHHFSTPYMAIATHLFGQGLVAMLAAQVTPADVLKHAETVFDQFTDPGFLAKLSELRDDKADIMAFVAGQISANAAKLGKNAN